MHAPYLFRQVGLFRSVQYKVNVEWILGGGALTPHRREKYSLRRFCSATIFSATIFCDQLAMRYFLILLLLAAATALAQPAPQTRFSRTNENLRGVSTVSEKI